MPNLVQMRHSASGFSLTERRFVMFGVYERCCGAPGHPPSYDLVGLFPDMQDALDYATECNRKLDDANVMPIVLEFRDLTYDPLEDDSRSPKQGWEITPIGIQEMDNTVEGRWW